MNKNGNETELLFLDTKNIVYPKRREEKEIEKSYSEIKILQDKNREKASKNRIKFSIY